jgi:oligosaccharide repeat unit polymerase
MSEFLVITIFFISVITGKLLFKKWFNPIFAYAFPWTLMIVLYEINLLSYSPLIPEVWFIIGLSYFCYLSGILIYFLARRIKEPEFDSGHERIYRSSVLHNYNDKLFRNTILIIGLIGCVGTAQHWYVLLKMFGSVPAVLINANLIYTLRVEGEIKGVVPYISLMNYLALFLAAVYSGHKGRITLVTLIPLVGVALKEIANVGRAGLFLAFLEFFTTYILVTFLYGKEEQKEKKKNNKLGFIILLVILIGSAVLVRSVRGTIENYSGASTQLNKLKATKVITPSIYLYFSSHVGILSKYFEEGVEETPWGSNTFFNIYAVLSKFDLVKKPSDYQRGYRIPMWSNTATYLREIHADFGDSSLFIIPFLMGIGSTSYWFRFLKKKKLMDLTILVNLLLIAECSFILMITRIGFISINFVILLFVAPLFDRYYQKKRELHA